MRGAKGQLEPWFFLSNENGMIRAQLHGGWLGESSEAVEQQVKDVHGRTISEARDVVYPIPSTVSPDHEDFYFDTTLVRAVKELSSN